MTISQALWAYLKDHFLGPRCAFRCGYRARGPRSLDWHHDYEHAGEEIPS